MLKSFFTVLSLSLLTYLNLSSQPANEILWKEGAAEDYTKHLSIILSTSRSDYKTIYFQQSGDRIESKPLNNSTQNNFPFHLHLSLVFVTEGLLEHYYNSSPQTKLPYFQNLHTFLRHRLQLSKGPISTHIRILFILKILKNIGDLIFLTRVF